MSSIETVGLHPYIPSACAGQARLTKLLLLFAALFLLPVARAVTVTVTIQGNVTGGTDTDNLFGFGTNYSFATHNKPFTLVYTFNDALGVESYSSIGGVPVQSIDQGNTSQSTGSPATSAVLTIGSGSWTWNSLPTNYQTSLAEANTGSNKYMEYTDTEDYTVGSGAGRTAGSATVSGKLYAPSGAITTNFDWRGYLATVSTKSTQTGSFTIDRTEFGPPVVYQQATGTLSPTSLQVQGPTCDVPGYEETLPVSSYPINWNPKSQTYGQTVGGWTVQLREAYGLSASVFNGGKVSEYSPPGTTDACSIAASGAEPHGAYTGVTGNSAPVGSAGQWGDEIGYWSDNVTYYQGHIASSLPCSASITQQMSYQCPGGTGPFYIYGGNNTGDINTDGATVTSTQAGTQRATESTVYKNWP